MSRLEPECPSCKERMVQGYLLDRGRNRVQPTHWIEGVPEKSFWTGLKTSDREMRTIVAFRCPRCGLLREYAL